MGNTLFVLINGLEHKRRCSGAVDSSSQTKAGRVRGVGLVGLETIPLPEL